MKVSKLRKFDAAEHLRTPEARAEYLSLVLTDGDPAEVRDALNLVACSLRLPHLGLDPPNSFR
jgi:DNA-binding phage protein